MNQPPRDFGWRFGHHGNSPFKARKDIRWGGFVNVRWGPFAALTAVTQVAPQQVLRAGYSRPLAWQVQAVITSALNAAEAATFTVHIITTFGTGTATATIDKTYTFAPPYAPIFDFGTLPAENINIQARVDGSPTVTTATEGVDIGVFAAPLNHDYHDSEGFDADRSMLAHGIDFLQQIARKIG